MKVILLEELKGKGGEGDVVDVAQGFAVNYLLPKKIAIQATSGNLKQLEQRKHNIARREVSRFEDANAVLEILQDKKIVVRAKVGEDGQLFGSVTAPHVAATLLDQYKVEVDKKKVDIKKPIKTAGEHEALVSIYRDVKAPVKILVVNETVTDEEVKALLRGESPEEMLDADIEGVEDSVQTLEENMETTQEIIEEASEVELSAEAELEEVIADKQA